MSQNFPSELNTDDQILAFGVVYEHGFTISRIYPKSLSDIEIKKQFEEECKIDFDDIYLINRNFEVHTLEQDKIEDNSGEYDFEQPTNISIHTNTQDELKQYNKSLGEQNKIFSDEIDDYDDHEDNDFDNNNDDGADV